MATDPAEEKNLYNEHPEVVKRLTALLEKPKSRHELQLAIESFCLCAVAFGAEFQADWDSLKNHAVPAWLIDAKFGIYAHWGVYSVPAFGNEWYGKRMYDPKGPAQASTSITARPGAPRTSSATRTSSPCSNAEKFNPEEWADAHPAIRRALRRHRGDTS